jgi:glucose/arabinose dehydrogenase/plastocyanin
MKLSTRNTCAVLGAAVVALGATDSAPAAKKRVLIVTASQGKRTSLTRLAEKRLKQATRSEGLKAVVVRKRITARKIRRASAVVFAAGEGTVMRRSAVKALNRRVRRKAGGVVFAGSAISLQPKSRDFITLLGAKPAGTDTAKRAQVQFVDRLHPATAMLRRRWNISERWVSLAKSPVGRVHVLGWVDEKTYTPGDKLAMGNEHPVTWCRDIGRGRSFTTTLGLSRKVWNARTFRRQMAGAIAYAAGTRAGGCEATIWSNWKRTVIDEDITDGTQIDVGPDGRVYYLERSLSQLKIYDPVADIVKRAGEIPSVPGLGQGLLGLALDPNFLKNHWLYIYRHVEGLNGRLSRFTLEDDQVNLLSEKVLLNVPNAGIDHNGGGLAMQSNGDLFLAIGANDMPHFDGQYGSRNPTPLGLLTETDAEATTQNSDSFIGKVLRVHPEPDGTYTIPAGNLFKPGTPKTRPEIYTMGHRNAFHIKVDDITGDVLEGDVGPDGVEDDPVRGPKGYDEFNLIKHNQGKNYGWPFCVGPNLAYNDIDSVTGSGSGKPFDCKKLVNRSPNNTGLTDLGPASPPLVWYPYGVGKDFPELSEAWAGGTDGGRLAIPGPLYRPFAGSTMPLFFGNSWFIADWARNWIKQLILDDRGRPLRIQRFAPFRGTQAPIDMELGTDGSLYVLEWGGQTLPVGNPLAAKVVRYTYIPRCGTCDPTFQVGAGSATPGVGTSGNVIAGPLAQTAGFLTTSVTLTKGAKLTFANLDAVAHNVASVDLDKDGQRLFASSNVATGTTAVEGTQNLDAGSYKFLCTVHPSMTGTLDVQ